MRMTLTRAAAGLILVSGTAMAQAGAPPAPAAPATPAATAQPAFAVPVEPLSLGKGKGGFMSVAFSVAGFNFSSATSRQGSGEWQVRIFGSTRKSERVVVKYKTTRDGAAFAEGSCSITVRMWSGLWNSAENSIYACEQKPGGAIPADFALEAVVPDMVAYSDAAITLQRDEPVRYEVLRARMRYAGAVYEAVPTGISVKQAERFHRAARGWLITRDGRPVGQIDFPSREGRFTDVMGSYDRKSIITAPLNAADGREAVLVFAAHLYFLPEANSPIRQEGALD